MSDKEVPQMAAALARSHTLAGARIIATAVDAPRALPPRDLGAAIGDAFATAGVEGTDVEAIGGVATALSAGLAAARAEGGALIVAGSLYLVGEVRGGLIDDPALRDPPPS
jgi:folylpolyglutamate synthase/dihydropteroate synthase